MLVYGKLFALLLISIGGIVIGLSNDFAGLQLGCRFLAPGMALLFIITEVEGKKRDR